MSKPTPVYPGAIAGDGQLTIAANRFQTTLTQPIGASDMQMTVADASRIVVNMLLSLDKDGEIVQVTGAPAGKVVPISRAFDGTSAVLHLAGATVSGMIDAWHHNALVAEVQAIENTLGPNLSRVPASNFIVSSAYDFPPQTPGGTLTAGTNQITLSPVPLGVNGSDSSHYLYIDQGTGTPEAVLITGGSATSGSASGTLFISCAGSHSGTWRISSATGGIQEAVYSGPQPVAVLLPNGVYTIHAPITVPYVRSSVRGNALAGITLNIASDFPLSASGVFVCPTMGGDGPQFENLRLVFIQPDSSNIGSYTHWPPAFYFNATSRAVIRHVSVFAAWNVVTLNGNCGGVIIEDLQASFFNLGISIDGTFDSVYLNQVRFWPYNLTSNQNTVMSTTAGITGILTGKCDDLNISQYFADVDIGIRAYASGSGLTYGNWSDVTLDSVSHIVIDAGYINLANLHQSVLTMSSPAIKVTEASLHTTQVRITNAYILTGTGPGTLQPFIQHTGGYLQVSNSYFRSYSINHNAVASTGGVILVSGCLFERDTGGTYSNATIAISGTARATLIGNRTFDNSGGSGTFISVGVDNFHQIRGNCFVGWAASFPPSPVTGTYESDQFSSYQQFGSRALNYINSETGAANAIACPAGSGPALTLGLKIQIRLGHTLQAGANTFAYNGGAAAPIVSHRSMGNIAAGYATSCILSVLWDGANWQDLSQ
jgi:hypothetical protein